MTTQARALGRLFDISAGISPVNLNTGANTGKRVSLRHAGGVTIVAFCGVGTAANDLALDVQEHSAASGGTSQDLDIVTKYYIKDELALDGDEAWVEVSQSAASEIAEAGANGESGEHEQIVVIEIGAEQLSDGFEYISCDIPQPGASKLGCLLYLLWDLETQRAPANLPVALS